MLFLLFHLDDERYALDATQIAEVLPLADMRAIPGAPAWAAGILMHRGEPVPVIDVTRLALGRASQRLRSTRLAIVRYRPSIDGGSPAFGKPYERRLGLVVERATQTARIARDAFRDSAIVTSHARWLGPIASDADGLVQWVAVSQILDGEARTLLFDYAASLAPSADGLTQSLP
ncbi:chemotaxis protein CheW [Burkholderia singularis]|uniref:Chemotaxis protein CheW n=1 Tax=Burkholderia singularis TaxID=1503053 RepID=A0A118DQ44_9BURK|nr:chemotaxis protein CheW [Burkholderia singularis]KVE28809.1 chemotaxis protein CheW [Burkholderia singularis]SMF99375.1 Chemotaxis signal transduction protein [Burkholderia singularis]